MGVDKGGCICYIGVINPNKPNLHHLPCSQRSSISRERIRPAVDNDPIQRIRVAMDRRM